ncbi:pre-peptidase C-terminal domain-containing protein [Flavobacterium piscinae]|nr:pre-peptidase C-terminal domain-containing protein [Flavobacterium piscinae]
MPNTRLFFSTNNSCSNAIPLSPTLAFYDLPLIGQSNLGISNSGELPNPTCGNYQGGDLWYTVTVPSNGNLNIETKGNTGDTALQVYSGSCGSLSLVGCDDNSGDGDFSLVSINNPALANQTLYIRVWEPGNDATINFDIAAWSSLLPTFPSTSLNFDGNNDYISGPNLPLANTSFSIEFWAKRSSTNTDDFVFFKGVQIII